MITITEDFCQKHDKNFRYLLQKNRNFLRDLKIFIYSFHDFSRNSYRETLL